MLFVARVDALRGVAREEVFVEGQAGMLLDHRHAVVLRGAGIDRRFVNDDIAGADDLANRLARRNQRSKVGSPIVIDGGRHRDDINAALTKRFDIDGES